MKRCPHRVSDRAVLRYLERVRGLNLGALRAEIGSVVAQAREHNASAAIVGGLRYVLGPGGEVVTVLKASRPPERTGSYRRKPEISGD